MCDIHHFGPILRRNRLHGWERPAKGLEQPLGWWGYECDCCVHLTMPKIHAMPRHYAVTIKIDPSYIVHGRTFSTHFNIPPLWPSLFLSGRAEFLESGEFFRRWQKKICNRSLFECMTFETLNKSQRSFGLPVGFLMALYCLFSPSSPSAMPRRLLRPTLCPPPQSWLRAG